MTRNWTKQNIRQVFKNGGSLAVNIPALFAQSARLDEGSQVRVDVETRDGRMVLVLAPLGAV